MLKIVLFVATIMLSRAFTPNMIRRSMSSALSMVNVGDSVPTGIEVDVITGSDVEAVDFGTLLKSDGKSVLFAVPGAFTPTCSEQHLPGFVNSITDLKAKGVSNVYCLSVNDKFVMKKWGLMTDGVTDSGIKMVADGNGDFTKAMGLTADKTGGRMGMRCTRFAAIIDNGVVKTLNVDSKGLDVSSAENILAAL